MHLITMEREANTAVSTTCAPTVSVCMPVYNAAPYVAEAVESVLGQTYADFELIIIDDGSTDESRVILERLAARDGRIRLVSRENRGIAATRNEALDMARGRLIACMDGDDVAFPERLAEQVRFLEEHPDVVCVGGGILLIDAKGRHIAPFIRPPDDETLQASALAGQLLLPQPCAMIRREALDRVGRYEADSGAEDIDLVLRLGEVGKLANVPRILVKYRVHAASISERACRAQTESARAACERAWKRRGIEGRFDYDELHRPGSNRASRLKFILKYGWWAFRAGERRTMMIYGLKAVALMPWSREPWRLLVCSLVKRMEKVSSL